MKGGIFLSCLERHLSEVFSTGSCLGHKNLIEMYHEFCKGGGVGWWGEERGGGRPSGAERVCVLGGVLNSDKFSK